MCATYQSIDPRSQDGYIPVENGELYYRQAGQGRPIVVLHGGPRFDHTYLLPDMDRLSDSYRLIYYDQRGRGKSTGNLQAISIRTEIEDLECLRNYLQLDSIALLGHSWGGYLAQEYAIHHPDRVSHLILMNTAFVSHEQYLLFQQELLKRKATVAQEWDRLASSTGYKEGDPQTVGDFYRVYFSTTIRRPQHLERVIEKLRLSFTRDGILRTEKISESLFNQTAESTAFNLIPQLKQLRTPTLIIHGDYDFIPMEVITEIAEAMPGARLILLRDCGHFSYVECPDEVRQAIDAFLPRTD